MPAKVRKAVFPAAGLGTRFLPATKAMPKEMLPVVDKPIIQYGVEEAIGSGIRNIIIVTGRGKSALEDHFDVSFELESLLESKHKDELLAIARGVSNLADVSYIRQKEALGLGHAVSRASELVGNEPFAVVLADDVIEAKTPCIRQLTDVYEKYDGPVLAVMEVPNDRISAYGVVDAEPVGDNVFRIRDMVEKPKASEAPSNLAIIGRYVLTSDIFRSLQEITPGAGGELQLTDGIRHLLKSRPVYACKFEGTRYDAGDKLGFLKATVEFALRTPGSGSGIPRVLEGPGYLTPSLFDLPIRPPEAAKLAVLVLEQAGDKPLTDEIRNRIASRAALLKLENLRPWFGSLERDPFHPSAIYCMAEGLDSQAFLMRLAPNATPSSGLFPKSILIGRMPGPGGIELVVNAVPFGCTSAEAIATFTAKVNRTFQPRPRGVRSAILVESKHSETVLPAAFEAFRMLLKERGMNFAGAADAQVGSWAAIRSGWREGFVSDAKDAVPAAQLTVRQRAVCVLQIDEPSEAAIEIEKCSQYLL